MVDLLATAAVFFREGFEAMLLITLLANMRNDGKMDGIYLLLGMALGLALTAVGVSFMDSMLVDPDEHQGLFSLVTALVLSYVVVFNAKITCHVTDHLREISTKAGIGTALAVALIAFREGAEVVLMSWGLMHKDPLLFSSGAVIGLLALFLTGFVLKNRLKRMLGTGRLMFISNVMLALLAFYFYIAALIGFIGAQ